MDFTGIHRRILGRVATMLEGNITPEQMAGLMVGLAAIKNATMPRNLLACEVTSLVNATSAAFPFPELKGNVQLVSVNGIIIRHKFWTWNVKDRILYLHNGYRFMVGQQVELYFNPE